MNTTFVLAIKKIGLQVFISFLAFNILAHAQEAKKNIIIGKKTKIHSHILDEDRELFIYLPEEYEESKDRYPVLYMLDGEWHFHHVSGILQFFNWTRKKIPPMILVAVSNTHRSRDFSPSTWPGYRTYTGGADTFIHFLEKELIPYVNQAYRTQPTKILAGHSLAGTFTLYAFFSNPEVFDAYISLSPCLFWHDRFMLKSAEAFLKSHKQLDKIRCLYIAHEYAEGSPATTMKEFVEAFQNRAPQNLLWTSLFKEDETHFSYVHKAIYDGLLFIFYSNSKD